MIEILFTEGILIFLEMIIATSTIGTYKMQLDKWLIKNMVLFIKLF